MFITIVHDDQARHFINTVISSDKGSLNLNATLSASWEESIKRRIRCQSATSKLTESSGTLRIGTVDLGCVNVCSVHVHLLTDSIGIAGSGSREIHTSLRNGSAGVELVVVWNKIILYIWPPSKILLNFNCCAYLLGIVIAQQSTLLLGFWQHWPSIKWRK